MHDRLKEHDFRRHVVRVIPNGIDIDLYKRLPDARQRLGWPRDSRIILHVAYEDGWHLNERKGLIDLMEAFVECVLPRVENAFLYVCGEGLVPNHERVHAIGRVPAETMPLLYSAADVVAVATIADNFPYTVIEALACEAAVVATRVGGIPEQITDECTGLLVAVRNRMALGNALVRILRRPEFARSLGIAGRHRVRELWTLDQFVQTHESLYCDLAHRSEAVASQPATGGEIQ